MVLQHPDVAVDRCNSWRNSYHYFASQGSNYGCLLDRLTFFWITILASLYHNTWWHFPPQNSSSSLSFYVWENHNGWNSRSSNVYMWVVYCEKKKIKKNTHHPFLSWGSKLDFLHDRPMLKLHSYKIRIIISCEFLIGRWFTWNVQPYFLWRLCI